MRIAQLAGPLERVPPAHYGGTERVVATLTNQLVRRGHDVTLFAAGGSQTLARLVPIVPEPAWQRDPPYDYLAYVWLAVIGAVMRQLDQFDVVHSHLEFFGFPLAEAAPNRVVSTLHGRQDVAEALLVHRTYPHVPLVSISDAQRAPVPNANWLTTIYHGIDLEEFTFRPRPGEYLAFLGRMSPEKGLDTAIRVAARAGMPVKVAARLPLADDGADSLRDRAYYREQIEPLAGSRHVEFLGEIGGRRRDAFLGHAAALLFPVRWPEPFGLVMAEALACGTPVLGLRQGSVPEVVEDGLTGFVCEDEDELVAAVRNLVQIDRARCRAAAESRFSAAVNAEQYERVYERMLAARRMA